MLKEDFLKKLFLQLNVTKIEKPFVGKVRGRSRMEFVFKKSVIWVKHSFPNLTDTKNRRKRYDQLRSRQQPLQAYSGHSKGILMNMTMTAHTLLSLFFVTQHALLYVESALN